MPTKTDLVKAKLAKNSSPDPATIKLWAKEGGYSPALVYKWIARLPDERRQAVSASEPVFTVEDEEEIIIEETEGGEEASDVPSFEEEPSEVAEEEPSGEIVIEGELEEEERRLRDIAGRAVVRIFDVLFSELLDLTKIGLTKQESDDTNFLTMLMVAKYLKVEIREYLLEFTASLHFGSLGLKVLVSWLKKRAEEKKKEEEKPVPEVRKKEDPKGEIAAAESAESVEEPTERVPMCVACGKQPVAPDSKAGLCISCQRKAQKAYIKKITGGNL